MGGGGSKFLNKENVRLSYMAGEIAIVEGMIGFAFGMILLSNFLKDEGKLMAALPNAS